MINITTIYEVETYLLKIFSSKVNQLEEKYLYYERVLKKSEKFNNKDEKIFFILKTLLKKIFDFNKEIQHELFTKEFIEFSNKFIITQEEFEKIFEIARTEKEKEYYNSPEIKKMVLEIKSELPIINSRIYNISLGLYTKTNGEELTLKEYSTLTGEDYQTIKKILKNTQKLIAKKLKRRLQSE